MNVNLIVIGKLKEDYLRSACAEYIKRLGRYCTFELHELDECRLSDDPSEKEIASALKKEAEQIKRYAKGMIIPMCIEGKQLTSPELAESGVDLRLSMKARFRYILILSDGFIIAIIKIPIQSARRTKGVAIWIRALSLFLFFSIYFSDPINLKRRIISMTAEMLRPIKIPAAERRHLLS